MLSRHRHCIVCNREYPKRIGYGLSGCYCTAICQAQAWADWIKSVRTCRYIACDCPGDRWHDRRACGKRTRGLLDGRCLECGHRPEAHQRRAKSSWDYGEEGA